LKGARGLLPLEPMNIINTLQGIFPLSGPMGLLPLLHRDTPVIARRPQADVAIPLIACTLMPMRAKGPYIFHKLKT